MPKVDHTHAIDKEIELGDHIISLDQVSIISAGHEMLPENFRNTNNLQIHASATTPASSKESIIRIVPEILDPRSETYPLPVAQAISAQLWDPQEYSGYSLTTLTDMDKTRKIIVNFTAEISMEGPWKIPLKE